VLDTVKKLPQNYDNITRFGGNKFTDWLLWKTEG